MELLTTVKATITALSVPSQSHDANSWLTAFELKPEAWQVADALVSEPVGSHFRFFGAITLYSKIQRDFHQLDSSIVPGFIQSLVNHLIRLANEPKLDMQMCRYLSLAIAAVAVQLNQIGVVEQILSWLNPIITSAPRVVLELLVVLPEECFNRNIEVSGDTRDAFASQLSATVGNVFNFLNYVRSQSKEENVNMQLLKCLERWIDNIPIPAQLLVNDPIFLFALESLGSEVLFEQAADVFIAVWKLYRCNEPSIVSTVFPRIVGLRNLFSAQLTALQAMGPDPDETCSQIDICRAITRLVAETLECCCNELIVSDTDYGQMELLALAIECVKFPYTFEISRIPLKFFYDLSCIVRSSKIRHRSEQQGQHHQQQQQQPQPDERDDEYGGDYYCDTSHKISSAAVDRLSAVFPVFLEAVVSHMVQPMNVIAGQRKASDSMLDRRGELMESVIDCVEAISAESCLQQLCMLLQKEVVGAQEASQPIRWNNVEAILFALHGVVGEVTVREAVLMPQVLTFLRTLPDMTGLKITMIRVVGKSSRWLSEHPENLQAVLGQLFSALPVQETGAEASKAVCQIFRHCASCNLPTDELFRLTLELRRSGKFPLDWDLILLEGFSSYISSLPPTSHLPATSQLLNPIVSSLKETLNSSSPECKLVNADVHRITTILSNVRIAPERVVELFVEILPLLQMALQCCRNENTFEKVCRCYKYVMKAAGTAFLPLLPSMCQHLTESFQVMPVSAFLYAASVCIATFGEKGDAVVIEMLYGMLWGMSAVFFKNMYSLEMFEKHPDLVEEYFYLVAKALLHCPIPLITNAGSGALVQAALTGLQLHHKEAQKGILLFFERLVALPLRLKHDGDEQACVVARQLVFQCGEPLVRMILLSLAGQMPAYAMDENHGCIGDVLWCLKLTVPDDLQNWLSQGKQHLPEIPRAHFAKMNLSSALCSNGERRQFLRTMGEFERKCRRK